MKEILQEVKEALEKSYDQPGSQDLDQYIMKLENLKEQYGDRGTMLTNTIQALVQAKNSLPQHENAGDVSSAAAFGQAFNALQQAIKSYGETDNDPV